MMTVDTDAAPPLRTRRLRPGAARVTRSLATPETALVLMLAAAVAFVHDVRYTLSVPYWTDEAWVAASTRFPLPDLFNVTASTPIGWTALLRVFIFGGDQRQRVLPLLFSAAAVIAGYWLGRQLGWGDRRVAVGAGVLCGFAVLTVPAMLVRNDLKQYTADACVSLVLLALISGLERSWSRRGLIGLCLAIPLAMLLSHVAAIVGSTALMALALVAAGRKQWRNLRDIVLSGTVTAAAMFAVYQVFDARAITPALKAYWRDYYLPVDQGFGASIDMIQSRFAELSPYLGLGPAWLVAALGSAGLVTIVCLGRVTVAVTLLLLIPAMISLSALKKYPLLDLRTSTFLLVLIEVTATIGVCGICALVVRRAALAGAVAIVPVIASLTQTHTFLRSHTIPPEDVRSQVRYVAGHRAPRDVILVDYASNWGFAYYWRQTVPEWHSTSTLGYVVSYPATQRIVVAADRTSAAIDSVVSQALTMRRVVPGTRIWLVRSHFRTAESKTWDQLLTAAGLSASRIDAAGLELFQAAKQPEGFR